MPTEPLETNFSKILLLFQENAFQNVICKMLAILFSVKSMFSSELLTHWGRVTHICVSKLTIVGSDNGLTPGRRQAITWTNAGILLIGSLWTNFSEILINILKFSFQKMHLNISSLKWQPFCIGLNVLNITLWGFTGTLSLSIKTDVLTYRCWLAQIH